MDKDGESLNAKIREGIVFKSIDGQFSFEILTDRGINYSGVEICPPFFIGDNSYGLCFQKERTQS